VRPEALEQHPAAALFDLPCACQNLRRVTRVVTRIYDLELRKAGLEITQFGLLTALALTDEATQKRLSAGFAMDSTTLTRTLGLLLKQGWVRVRRGKDRRSVCSVSRRRASDKWQKLNRTGSGRNSDCGENLATRVGKT
jgi:DNA-binding MarR family transcriptional regulator